MKVLCIDDKRRPGDYPATPMVKEGCIYNTTGICNGYGTDSSVELSYYLQEFDKKYVFDVDRFVPLSDISETEMKRDYNLKQLAESNDIAEISICLN